jgi:hypothetical protein
MVDTVEQEVQRYTNTIVGQVTRERSVPYSTVGPSLLTRRDGTGIDVAHIQQESR